ncbi:MAG: A24 family peptidase [Hyphomonadaceae bacterium]|nr:A24 family peptidase [Hyphomonadaceae bacterium]
MIVHAATALLALLLGAVAVVDARTQRIPDALNIALVVSGLAATALLERDLVAALVGVAAGYGAIALVNGAYRRLRGRDGIGMGDAKLLAGAGAWLGWTGLPFVVLIGATLGIAAALALRVRAHGTIAFGPFLAAGFFAVWIATMYGR